MHVKRTLLVTAVVGGLALSMSTRAEADKATDKKECAAAYSGAQKSMRATNLRTAREQLGVCSRDVCLAAIRKDCVGWLDEVNASLPSIVIEAKGPDGKETLDVKVSLLTPSAASTPTPPTPEVLTTKLDVKAIELDPGTFILRFEREGSAPIEKEVVLRQGQKNKLIEVSWAQPAAATPDKKDEKVAIGKPGDKADGGPKQKSVLPYVIGGLGVALAAGGAFFWLKSESQRSDLESSCAPRCETGQADDIKTQRLVGDILAGVGVLAIGAAVVLVVTDMSSSSPKGNGNGVKWTGYQRILANGFTF